MRTYRINTVAEKKIPEGLRLYVIYVCESLRRIYEDPKCPPSWHGSGCYDIEEYTQRYHRIKVCAANRQQACGIVLSLEDVYQEEDPEILDVRFLSCERTSEYSEGDVLEIESEPSGCLDWSKHECHPSLSNAIRRLDLLKRFTSFKRSA